MTRALLTEVYMGKLRMKDKSGKRYMSIRQWLRIKIREKLLSPESSSNHRLVELESNSDNAMNMNANIIIQFRLYYKGTWGTCPRPPA